MTSSMRCTVIPVLFVVLTGCRFFGKGKPEPIPTPDPPRPVATVPAPKVEPPGPPPKIETKAPEVPSEVALIPTPPAPKPVRKKPVKKPATVPGIAQAPPQTVGPPVTDPPPTVKLGEILSDDQKLLLWRICDESLSRAKEALRQLHGLSMSQDQKQSIARIRTFIFQAEQARQKDPQTAKQLAERADLLSRDLVKTVR